MSFLHEFTKEEIISWLEADVYYCFNPPKKSNFLFVRWQKRTEELKKKRKKSMQMLEAIDGKKRDELAEQFNNESDWQKRLAIAKKIEPYEKQFKAWKEYEQAIMKEEAEVEKIYQSIDKARNEERLKTAST